MAKVSLTGSVATAKGLCGGGGGHAPCHHGAKSPLIVFDDASLEDAVGAAMLANFYSSGQIRSNGTLASCRRISPRSLSGWPNGWWWR